MVFHIHFHTHLDWQMVQQQIFTKTYHQTQKPNLLNAKLMNYLVVYHDKDTVDENCFFLSGY